MSELTPSPAPSPASAPAATQEKFFTLPKVGKVECREVSAGDYLDILADCKYVAPALVIAATYREDGTRRFSKEAEIRALPVAAYNFLRRKAEDANPLVLEEEAKK
jgi:hypothetical protein